MKPQLFAIIAAGLAALGVLVAHYYRPSRRAERSDVGLALVVEDPSEDEPVDDESGDKEQLTEAEEEALSRLIAKRSAEPTYPLEQVREEVEATGIELAYYGSTQVHKHCLNARRDGLVACSDCSAILSAVKL